MGVRTKEGVSVVALPPFVWRVRRQLANDLEACAFGTAKAMNLNQLVRHSSVLEDQALAGRVTAGMHVPVIGQGDLVELVCFQIIVPEPVVPSLFARGVRLVKDAAAGHDLVAHGAVLIPRAEGSRVAGVDVQEPHAAVVLDVIDQQAVLVDKDQMVDVKVQCGDVAPRAGLRVDEGDGCLYLASPALVMLVSSPMLLRTQ